MSNLPLDASQTQRAVPGNVSLAKTRTNRYRSGLACLGAVEVHTGASDWPTGTPQDESTQHTRFQARLLTNQTSQIVMAPYLICLGPLFICLTGLGHIWLICQIFAKTSNAIYNPNPKRPLFFTHTRARTRNHTSTAHAHRAHLRAQLRARPRHQHHQLHINATASDRALSQPILQALEHVDRVCVKRISLDANAVLRPTEQSLAFR